MDQELSQQVHETKCALWLEKKLLNYTQNVIVQEANTRTYDEKSHVLKNIIASFNPEMKNRIAFIYTLGQ